MCAFTRGTMRYLRDEGVLLLSSYSVMANVSNVELIIFLQVYYHLSPLLTGFTQHEKVHVRDDGVPAAGGRAGAVVLQHHGQGGVPGRHPPRARRQHAQGARAAAPRGGAQGHGTLA